VACRFEPSELLERLAAMIPRPRANQLIYHGAYAPRGVKHERAWSEAVPAHCEKTTLMSPAQLLSIFHLCRGSGTEFRVSAMISGSK
jgi:hypothetical protein